jgi:uncharacterized RDD family membrane protein YckC
MECGGCGSVLRNDARICLSCGEMVRKRVAPGDRLEAVPAGVPHWIAFDPKEDAASSDLPASRTSRVLAFVVDSLILGGFGALASIQFATDDRHSYEANGVEVWASGVPLWLMVSLWALGLVYAVGFPASKVQGTPGKKLLGLRITNLEGERINFFQSFMRYLGQAVFFGIMVPLMLIVGVFCLALPVAILFLMGDGRSPWDYIAGTKVVD